MNSQGYKLVETEYSKLQDCIGDLAEMMNGTLASQKEEIEKTHMSEMRKVKEELDNMKLEKTKLEESIATNERACLLETERDWYKKEALHLDKVLEQTNARQKELMERLDESEHDRKWMKVQIEQLTKSNWAFKRKLKELGVEMDCREECMHDKLIVEDGKPSSDVSDSTEVESETNHG
eukprot:CCRYP_009010-RA/>CCRYP_009010-RA protein AED:0.46 eAED:0.46 QI:129/1/1/1/1/1/3/94/178